MKSIIMILVILLNVLSVSTTDKLQANCPEYDLGHGFTYGIDYSEYDEEKTAEIKENLTLQLSNDEPEIKNSVSSFDISENGRTAIALPSKEILVYNEQMEFEYSICFEEISGIYGVLWAGEYITLMNGRSDSAYVLSDKGELLAAYKINTENNLFYWEKIVCTEERITGGNRYYLNNICRNRYGEYMTAYEELVLSDSHGAETTLYRADEERYDKDHWHKYGGWYAGAAGIVVLIFIYLKFCKNKELKTD